MEGSGQLRTWEKVYWGLFVGGMAVLLYTRLLMPEAKKPDPQARARPPRSAQRSQACELTGQLRRARFEQHRAVVAVSRVRRLAAGQSCSSLLGVRGATSGGGIAGRSLRACPPGALY
jgi:hypothetical protein